MQYLTDDAGLSPTVGELRQMMRIIKLYCRRPSVESQHRSLFFSIDFMFNKKTDPGERHKRVYLKSSSDCGYSSTRSRVVMEWIAAVEARFEGLEDSHVPKAPICEVSYAKSPIERLKSHANHRSSNYIMNLAEATCRVLFSNRNIHIDQFVAYHLCTPEEGTLAEILFSRLLNAYITFGGGFSHHPAGLSNRSAWDDFHIDQWRQWIEIRSNTPWFLGNMKNEVIKARQKRNEIDQAFTKEARKLLEMKERARLAKEKLKALDKQMAMSMVLLKRWMLALL